MTSLNWAEIAARAYTFPAGTNVKELQPEALNSDKPSQQGFKGILDA